MIKFNFPDIELLLAHGREENLREVFQRTLLKIIEKELTKFNNQIDEHQSDIDGLTDEQDALMLQPFTEAAEDEINAIGREIDWLRRVRSSVLGDRRDFMSVLWILARSTEFYGKWDETAIAAIEDILAKHKERLSKTGMADRKEIQKVGRPATKLRALVDQIRAGIAGGTLAREELEKIPVKRLSHRFGAHRDTASRARQIVLKDQDGYDAVVVEESDAEKIGNAIIEFPTQKTFISE